MTQTKQKECFKCHVIKPLTDFYAHPQMADGRLGKCKECMKSDVKNNYAKNKPHYQSYDKDRANLPHRVKARLDYANSDEGRVAGSRAKKSWETRNPEKKSASTAVSNAVRDGKLIRKTECELCRSSKNIEAHHEDYSRPLEVIWLCKKHHWKADERRREEESRNAIASQQVPTF